MISLVIVIIVVSLLSAWTLQSRLDAGVKSYIMEYLLSWKQMLAMIVISLRSKVAF